MTAGHPSARWTAALARRLQAVPATEQPADEVRLLSCRTWDDNEHAYAESVLAAPVRLLPCTPDEWTQRLQAYEQSARALDAPPVAGPADTVPEDGLDDVNAATLAEEASPVVRVINAMLHDALLDRASDVHVERIPAGARVRFRIDGVMVAAAPLVGGSFADQVVSRLKVMAELDIGERRIPQDGRFRLRILDRVVDFRLSILPSSHGEDAVVRLLDPSRLQAEQGRLSLEALGFDEASRRSIRQLALLPHGMLLVTGPTGSGKTTTLYAAMGELPLEREKIITIEDPVEYRVDGTVQIPVNERKGLTFARGLRSILRHDPDRVMVGEIRDPETAQIAVQAALTGHLVFSTVHANHAFDVIGRFMHMGLDLYNVVSALNGVLAQRLVRMVCPQCARPARPTAELWSTLGLEGSPRPLMQGVGCNHCRGTGYRGRRAVSEALLLDDELRDAIASRQPMGQIKQLARGKGMVPLRQKALECALEGLTTLEEVNRVTLAA